MPTRRCRRIPGLFAAGECASGINGANRLGGNSLSDLIVFGKLAGEYAAEFARKNAAVTVDRRPRSRGRSSSRSQPFDRGAAGENPYKVQEELQDTMQSLVGIVRLEDEMVRGVAGGSRATRSARRGVGVAGHREYNAGWHTALDLQNLLTVAEAITRLGRSSARKAAAATSARTIPDKAAEFGKFNIMVKRAPDGGSSGVARADSGDAGGVEAGHRGAETVIVRWP